MIVLESQSGVVGSIPADGADQTVVFSAPSGASPGDVLVAVLRKGSNPGTMPSGWTAVMNGESSFLVAARVVDGAEGSSLTFRTYGPSLGWLGRFSGVDPLAPFDASPQLDGSGWTAQPSCPAVATVTDGAMVLAAIYQSFPDYALSVSAVPTGFSLVAAGNDPNAVRGLALANKVQSPPGTVGPGTWTLASATTYSRTTFALRPVTSATPDYTLTAPANGAAPPGVESDEFTVSLRPGLHPVGDVTVTPSVSGTTGAFTPATVRLSDTVRGAAFRFVPAEPGEAVVSISDDAGLNHPDAVNFTCAYTPLTGLAAYESNMLSWGAAYPGTGGTWLDGTDHYDPARAFQYVADYTGDRLTWQNQADIATYRYRDVVAVPNGGAVQGYHAWNLGMVLDVLRNRDARSRYGALLVSQKAAYCGSVEHNPDFSREMAFNHLDQIQTELLGLKPGPIMADRLEAMKQHVAWWTDTPPGSRPYFWYCQPFMASLTLEALAAHYDRYRDPEIPPLIKHLLDWLWTDCWQEPAGFPYIVANTSTVSGVVAASPTPTATAFQLDGVPSGNLINANGTFTSGALNNAPFKISDYNVTTRLATVASLSAAPAPGDTFQLAGGSFNAADLGPAPDLSTMIAPFYAWYYRYSVLSGNRDNNYRFRHDKVFDVASSSHAISTSKVYNQSYRISTQGLRWRAEGDSPVAAETALAVDPIPVLTGQANAYSESFLVSLAGTATATASSVTVTPDDQGGGGAFLPASAVLTTDRRTAYFLYRPASTGVKTIAVTNDGGLANPAPFTYTVTGSIPVAADFTLTGPVSGEVGSPLGPFIVAWSPEGATAPLSLSGYGGSTPIQVGVDPYSPPFNVNLYADVGETATEVWFTPDAAGTFTLTFMIPGIGQKQCVVAVAEAAAPSTAARSYSLNVAACGEVGVPATSTIRLVPDGATTSGDVTITLTDNAGGVFTPPSVALSTASPSTTFTYTPAAPGGRVRITGTNDGGLTDPPPRTFFAKGGPLASAVTLSGPSTVNAGSASAPFTAALADGAIMGTARVYPRSSGAGSFSPQILELDNTNRQGTFTFTPEGPGEHAVTVAVGRGLAAPEPVLLTVAGGGAAPEPPRATRTARPGPWCPPRRRLRR